MTDDALCAEYVIGVMPEAERAQFEKRLRAEPDLRLLEAFWLETLAPLNQMHTPVAAPNLLPQIERRLFGQVAAPRLTCRSFANRRGAVVLLVALAIIAAKLYLTGVILGL